MIPQNGTALSDGGRQTVSVTIIFSVIATICVGMRFWARRIRNITPLLEDWMVVGALVRTRGER